MLVRVLCKDRACRTTTRQEFCKCWRTRQVHPQSISKYTVIIKEEAQADLRKLLSYEPKAYNKALRFIGERSTIPRQGWGILNHWKGSPKDDGAVKSQEKHRLIYRILIQKSMLMCFPPMGIMMTSFFIFIQMLIVYSYSIHIASRAASADKSESLDLPLHRTTSFLRPVNSLHRLS